MSICTLVKDIFVGGTLSYYSETNIMNTSLDIGFPYGKEVVRLNNLIKTKQCDYKSSPYFNTDFKWRGRIVSQKEYQILRSVKSFLHPFIKEDYKGNVGYLPPQVKIDSSIQFPQENLLMIAMATLTILGAAYSLK